MTPHPAKGTPSDKPPKLIQGVCRAAGKIPRKSSPPRRPYLFINGEMHILSKEAAKEI